MHECTDCSRVFDTKKGRNIHYGQVHADTSQETVCEECGTSFVVNVNEYEGRFCSNDCRLEWLGRWSEEQTGESHPNWKPGTCERRGDNWEEQRLKAILRDQARCQNCRKPAHVLPRGYVDLCVHHIVRYGDFDSYEEANRVDNLVTLCRSCHCKVENTGDKIWMK